MSMSLVVIGAGDLGLRVAHLRAKKGDAVWTLRRRTLPTLAGVHMLSGDMHRSEDLKRLPTQADNLLFCPTPDVRSEQGYRRTYVEALAKVLQALRPKRVLFVSSTAVYAQNEGQWVDESSLAEADSFNGRVLREGERLCLAQSGNSVLRLSGITGPGRHMLVNKALLGEGLNNTWTNRIHVEDAAAAIAELTQQNAPENIYNISDDQPALQVDVANWIRAQHNLPALPVPEGPAKGKKVANSRIKATGWRPLYPSYRENYLPGAPMRSNLDGCHQIRSGFKRQ